MLKKKTFLKTKITLKWNQCYTSNSCPDRAYLYTNLQHYYIYSLDILKNEACYNDTLRTMNIKKFETLDIS